MDVRNPLQSALKDNRPYALQKALKSLGQEDSVTLFNTLEMLQRNEAIVLDERHFTVGVSSCGRSELWQHACWLFEAMPKANIQPDVISSSQCMRKGWGMAARSQLHCGYESCKYSAKRGELQCSHWFLQEGRSMAAGPECV